MWLKSQVRFLEGLGLATASGYSANFHVPFLEEGEQAIAYSFFKREFKPKVLRECENGKGKAQI